MKTSMSVLLLLAPWWVCSNAGVPLTKFFPFGAPNGDTILEPAEDGAMENGSSPEIGLSISFPFFDSLHSSLWVNVNGALSFVRAISEFSPICEPVQQDHPMIAPLWSDMGLTWNGTIFYRESFTKEVIEKAKDEIVRAFPQFETLQLKWAFLTTWYNVKFNNAEACASYPRSTFQSVLVTDGVHSFAIFYYNSIAWTIDEASGGNCSGLGEIPPKVGFDAGDGKNYFMVPGSCTLQIVNISQMSNVGSPGTWIFRIDIHGIQHAGCKEDFHGPLSVVPTFVDMFGHVPIEIIGPCFNDSLTPTCQFHDPAVGVTVIPGTVTGDQDHPMVTCLTPFFYTSGRLSLDLILDINGKVQTYTGFLHVIPPPDNGDRVHISSTPISEFNSSVTWSWKPSFFLPSDLVDIEVYSSDSSKPTWTPKVKIATGILNNGSFTKVLKLSDFAGIRTSKVILFSVKPQVIERTSAMMLLPTEMFSKAMLVWDVIKNTDGSWCLQWYVGDSGSPGDLLRCPPTKKQALADPRFEFDPSCKRSPCFFHPGADFCVRSKVPSPSGAGQQCCYTGGSILLGPPGGGTVDKCHWKTFPWFVCHISEDVRPWYYCCKGKPMELCRLYYEKRLCDPGTNYESPEPGRGDPTLDPLGLNLKDKGEF